MTDFQHQTQLRTQNFRANFINDTYALASNGEQNFPIITSPLEYEK
jgi:hypothetical protein